MEVIAAIVAIVGVICFCLTIIVIVTINNAVAGDALLVLIEIMRVIFSR